MKEFYVTFGQKYRRELHPQAINGVYPHPDGWFTIAATNLYNAQARAESVFGEHYAFVYPSLEELRTDYYPLGELGKI